MASIALNYNSIYNAAKNAKKVADNAEDYVSGLQKKIINKIDSLVGTNTEYTSNARSNTEDKIKRLNEKKDAYSEYSTKLEKFVDEDNIGAKAVDKRVAKMFEKDGEEFRDNNNIKINPVTQFFTFLANEFTNASDFVRGISDGYTDVKNWLSDKWDSIKDWYRYEGGKFWVNIGKALLCIGIAIATIVVTVLTGGIGLVAICAIIGSVIAIADGIVSCGQNIKSLISESSDPAYALKLSKTDKLSTYLRKKDTGSGGWNTALNYIAGGIDLVEAGCTVVTIVGGIAELGKRLPAIKNVIGDESKGLLKSLLDKSVRNSKGEAVVTFKSLKNGLKTLVTDPNVRKQISNKFKADGKFFLKNIKETIHYEWKHNIKGMVTDLAISPEARRRYADILKVQLGKNTSKFWKDTVGNVSSGKTLEQAKGIKNILKLTKTGMGNFGYSASSGNFDVMSNIKSILKNTYLSMDDKTKAFSEGFDNINDIKENIGKVSDRIDRIKTAPAY